MRFVDQDTGESVMDVVAVPEGVSIQIGDSENEYVSVVLKPERIDDLFRLLWKIRHQSHAKPTPAPALPRVAMLQLNSRDEAMVIQFAMTAAVALLAMNPDRAANAANGMRHHAGTNPMMVANVVERLTKVTDAAWPDEKASG